MRHRFRISSRPAAPGERPGKDWGPHRRHLLRFRCKRCGVAVEMMAHETGAGRSPYDVLRREGVPTDCNAAVAGAVMDS